MKGRWSIGSLLSPFQDYQGFTVSSLIEWDSREAWPLAEQGFLTREVVVIACSPIIFTCSSSSGKLSQRFCQDLLRDNRLSVSLLFSTEKGEENHFKIVPEDVKEFWRLSEAASHITLPTEHLWAAADTVAFHNAMVHWKPRILDVTFLLYLKSHHTISYSLGLECLCQVFLHGGFSIWNVLA